MWVTWSFNLSSQLSSSWVELRKSSLNNVLLSKFKNVYMESQYNVSKHGKKRSTSFGLNQIVNLNSC